MIQDLVYPRNELAVCGQRRTQFKIWLQKHSCLHILKVFILTLATAQGYQYYPIPVNFVADYRKESTSFSKFSKVKELFIIFGVKTKFSHESIKNLLKNLKVVQKNPHCTEKVETKTSANICNIYLFIYFINNDSKFSIVYFYIYHSYLKMINCAVVKLKKFKKIHVNTL